MNMSADDRTKVVPGTLLHVEEIEPCLFRSTNLFNPAGGKIVYGGQLIGQALAAAYKTVPEGRDCHSLHCYFLRPGKNEQPVEYQVVRTRDGATYSNRFVQAAQLGKTIFTMMVSFNVTEANIFSHQFTMPDVPGPEDLKDVDELLGERLEEGSDDKEGDSIERRINEQLRIEIKPVDKNVFFGTVSYPAKLYMWMKVRGHIGENQQEQNCAAAFISDVKLLSLTIFPASPSSLQDFFLTSIDHSIWFHHSIKADEWFLYEMESPTCGHGRGHTVGRVWNRDGTLVMSVSQEGVVRPYQRNASSQSVKTPKPRL